MRMFGFLAGALVVAAALAVWQGPAGADHHRWISRTPDVLPPAGESRPGPTAAETAAKLQGSVLVTRPASPVAAERPEVSGPGATSSPGAGPVTAKNRDADPSGAIESAPEEPEESPTNVARADAAGPGDRWEVFFTPFRSEASAQGFARFLQSATGREFAVRRAGPGDYRVWFSMAAGESRPERLAEIEAVTGMVLAGGEF